MATESNAPFEAIYSSESVAIVTIDGDGLIVRANTGFNRLLGYRPGALRGRPLLDLLHPDDAAPAGRLLEELLGGERSSLRVEKRFIDAGDQTLWVRFSASRLDKGADAAVAFLEDVSARRQAESALRDREADLRAILDTAADGIITIDEAGVVLTFNAAAEAMFGFPAAEVIGQNVSLLMPSADRDRHDDYIRRYVETGQARIIGSGREVDGRRKDGSHFPVLIAVSEVQQAGGRTFTGFVRDITAIKEAEQSMRRERDMVERLIRTAQDIVLVLDNDGKIVRFNSYMEKLGGWSLDEVRGQTWFETFLPDEDQARVHDIHSATLAGVDTSGTVNSIRTRNGEIRLISWSNSAIEDEQGSVVGILAIGHDITEIQEAQRRLVQSERLAAIGEMVTGLAHESRNALQRIQACLEMLELEVEDNAEAKDLVGRIQRAQDQLAMLYDDVRAYARPILLQTQACEVDRLWRATWADLELEHAEKGIELRENCAESRADVDPYAMQQVFRNIFENSIGACPEEGGWVRVRCEADGARLTLRFVDNGPGLGGETLKRIFDPFYTTKTRGSGLGMPIVKRIVESHGGGVEAKNSEGGGAEIILTLPRAR